MTSLRGHERTEFPAKVRQAAFRRCCRDGRPYCEGCDEPIRGTPIYEHAVPDGLGGEPTLENCKVHCKTCADKKTFTEDNPRMQKADAVLKHTYGLEPTKRKIASRPFEKRAPQRTATRPIERRTMRLTEKQIQHLQALAGEERGAYPGLHMGVLNSLSLKGLVKARNQIGSIFSPHTAIKWRITDAGRGALASRA